MMATIEKHPPVQQTYAAYTQQGFLLREVGLVAERLIAGIPEAELKQEVLEDDLFQLASAASRKTALMAIRRRLEGVPISLLTLLSEGSLDLRRLTNTYLILLKHRLLREFIAEVILEAASRLSYTVPQAEVNAFMVYKRNQVPEIEGWSEATVGKVRSSLVNLCVNAGLLERVASGWSIQTQHVPAALREELAGAQRQRFLRLLLDPEAI